MQTLFFGEESSIFRWCGICSLNVVARNVIFCFKIRRTFEIERCEPGFDIRVKTTPVMYTNASSTTRAWMLARKSALLPSGVQGASPRLVVVETLYQSRHAASTPTDFSPPREKSDDARVQYAAQKASAMAKRDPIKTVRLHHAGALTRYWNIEPNML